jgi:rod shape-determining protein MreD
MMILQGAQRLDPIRWLFVPAILSVLAVLMFAIPLRLFGLALPEPVWPLAPVFAWAVIRPSLLAPFVAIATGLLLDLVWGAPAGFWALTLMVGYGVILLARNMMTGQSFAVLWAWFGLMCAIVFAAAYLFAMLDSGSTPDVISTVLQAVPSVLLYPLAHRLIERFEDADVRFR